MHELAIALSVIECATEEIERRGLGRVAGVRLRVGALSGVVSAALASAYELAREGSPLAGAELHIEEVPVTLLCPACGDERPAVSPMELCCQLCGTFSSDVVQGRELELCGLEVQEAA